VFSEGGRGRLAAGRLRGEGLTVLVEEARVDPVRSGLRGEPQMVGELRGAQRHLRGLGGERRERLTLRVYPALEGEGGQLRLLPQCLVELRAVALPHAADVRHADEPERDGDADGEYQ
jgi:hypothetical protein